MSLVKRVEELNQNFSPNACCNILLEIAKEIELLKEPKYYIEKDKDGVGLPEGIVSSIAGSDVVKVKTVEVKKGRPKKNV